MGKPKLTPQQVEAIKAKYISMATLATEFGVTRQRIQQILSPGEKYIPLREYINVIFEETPGVRLTIPELADLVETAGYSAHITANYTSDPRSRLETNLRQALRASHSSHQYKWWSVWGIKDDPAAGGAAE